MTESYAAAPAPATLSTRPAPRLALPPAPASDHPELRRIARDAERALDAVRAGSIHVLDALDVLDATLAALDHVDVPAALEREAIALGRWLLDAIDAVEELPAVPAGAADGALADRPEVVDDGALAIDAAARAELRQLLDGAITMPEALEALEALLVALDAVAAGPERIRVERWLLEVLAGLRLRARLDAAARTARPALAPEARAAHEEHLAALAHVFARLAADRLRRVAPLAARPRRYLAAGRERRARRTSTTGTAGSRGDPPDEPPPTYRPARHVDGGTR